MEWSAIVLLGAYHGINPGMGWLFAVALGMQAGSLRGVYRALPPIALGHAAAVGAVLLAAAAARLVVPPGTVRAVAAATLIAFGVYRLCRTRHPRFGGMQVGFRDLALWSFLMASAHGAGLMVLPFAVDLPVEASDGPADHSTHLSGTRPGAPLAGASAVGLHSLAYLAVMSLMALVVYLKLGLALLRTAWFNLDWLWTAALILTGGLILAM